MKTTIYLIEDEAGIAETVQMYLGAKGYTVRHFASVEEFDEQPRTRNSFYLVDWNLPGKKGIDLIRELRQAEPLSPIFMLSGYNQSEEIVMGLAAGADDYLTKPFNLEELAVRIGNACSKLDHLEGNLLSYGTTPSFLPLTPLSVTA